MMRRRGEVCEGVTVRSGTVRLDGTRTVAAAVAARGRAQAVLLAYATGPVSP